jgi:hypothetical protein
MIRGSSKLIIPTVNIAFAAVLLTVGYTRPTARVGAGTVGNRSLLYDQRSSKPSAVPRVIFVGQTHLRILLRRER